MMWNRYTWHNVDQYFFDKSLKIENLTKKRWKNRWKMKIFSTTMKNSHFKYENIVANKFEHQLKEVRQMGGIWNFFATTLKNSHHNWVWKCDLVKQCVGWLFLQWRIGIFVRTCRHKNFCLYLQTKASFPIFLVFFSGDSLYLSLVIQSFYLAKLQTFASNHPKTLPNHCITKKKKTSYKP